MSDTDSGVPEESSAHYVEGRAEPTAALRTVLALTLRTDLRRVLAGCPLEQSGLRENLRAIATGPSGPRTAQPGDMTSLSVRAPILHCTAANIRG